jgi:hypothetical protein
MSCQTPWHSGGQKRDTYPPRAGDSKAVALHGATDPRNRGRFALSAVVTGDGFARREGALPHCLTHRAQSICGAPDEYSVSLLLGYLRSRLTSGHELLLSHASLQARSGRI